VAATNGEVLSVKRLAAVESMLTLAEVVWVAIPLYAGAAALGVGLSRSPALVVLAVALLLALVLRFREALRPVRAVASARQNRDTVSVAAAEDALRVLSRLPSESGLLRAAALTLLAAFALLWGRAEMEMAVTVAKAPQSWLLTLALLASAVVHAAGAGSLRALVFGVELGRLRGLVLPTAEGLRLFAMRYRRWLLLLGLCLVGGAHLIFTAVVMSLGDVSVDARAATTLYLWPVLVPGAMLWSRSLIGRVRPIESYFDATMRSPGTRGPARDEPRAVVAFRAVQSLPYRLGGYAAFVLILAGVTSVAAARRSLPLSLPSAARLLVALAIVVALTWVYGILLGRRVLAPLVRHLGSRHALPIAEIRSRVGLASKLVVVFAVIAVTSAATVGLVLGAPANQHQLGWAIAVAVLAAAAIVGLIVLVTRGVVDPIHALEARSEEMARGELARPLPPSGEADEIGRLAVAFEEMRRALRDRLRSTESINIDLEREVRRRTDALEQRNLELREALEKLRRAQDNLVRSEKLASMGRLVAGIAHEINNPVNAVINSLGPLEETVKQLSEADKTDDLASSAAEMLAVVKRGAARTKAIVQALHNYSRGDETVEREINLERSVEDSLDLLRHRLRGVKVVKEIAPGARMMGLPGQIDQVLMNLITNAAQAIGEGGGTIQIAIRLLVEGVEINVVDDGPGMPPEVQARIFDPFFTTKDVGEGSGLGLSIVHGIVERHGGRIDVETAVGRGTTFRLLFPHVAERIALGGTGTAFPSPR
jgi:signal transduction histidine kinase